MGILKKVEIEMYCPQCHGEKTTSHGDPPVTNACPYCNGEGVYVVGYIKLPKSLFDEE